MNAHVSHLGASHSADGPSPERRSSRSQRATKSSWSKRLLGGVGILLATTTAVALGCAGPAKRPDGGVGLLPVGADAPEISARDLQGQPVQLSSFRGHPVVVYFYPQDGTPGCTKEACAFRNAWKRYENAGVEVIGVSTNSEARHREFQKDEHLPFPLASDEDGAVGGRYGVKKHLWGFDRVSFLIDKEGKVARVYPNVDPAVHANQVLREVTNL